MFESWHSATPLSSRSTGVFSFSALHLLLLAQPLRLVPDLPQLGFEFVHFTLEMIWQGLTRAGPGFPSHRCVGKGLFLSRSYRDEMQMTAALAINHWEGLTQGRCSISTPKKTTSQLSKQVLRTHHKGATQGIVGAKPTLTH